MILHFKLYIFMLVNMSFVDLMEYRRCTVLRKNDIFVKII